MSMDRQSKAEPVASCVPHPLPPSRYAVAGSARTETADRGRKDIADPAPPMPLPPAAFAVANVSVPEVLSGRAAPAATDLIHPLLSRADSYRWQQTEPTREGPSSSEVAASAPASAEPPPVAAPGPLGAYRPANPTLSTAEVQAPDAVIPPPAAPPLVRTPPARPRQVSSSPDELAAKSPAGWLDWAKTAAFWLVAVVAGYVTVVCLLLVVYRFVDPPFSMLMVQRALGGTEVRQTWVPIEEMSPNIVRAVLVSEDGRFCQHPGVDIQEIQNAIERGGDGTPRGASTISMQVVKNMFLWPAKSYVRKAIELPLTLLMELVWSKRRVMEVYLNIAEWGPGIFGVEAAARYHFKQPASALSERQAARLAVSLPNPFTRIAGNPGPGTRRLATVIQRRMRQVGRAPLLCVLPDPKAASGASKK